MNGTLFYGYYTQKPAEYLKQRQRILYSSIRDCRTSLFRFEGPVACNINGKTSNVANSLVAVRLASEGRRIIKHQVNVLLILSLFVIKSLNVKRKKSCETRTNIYNIL